MRAHLFTRRDCLLLALCLPLRAATQEFWEKKPPEQWSESEIEHLLTRSPWAKPVSGAVSSFGRSATGGGRRGGLRLPGGIGGRGGPASSAPESKGTVRWEGAAPVLAALKTKLPDSFAAHYVISVNGFRSDPEESEQDALDHMKAVSYLQPLDKADAQPGVVERQVSTGGSSSFLLGFSKELLNISAGDKEVTFTTRIGRATIKAKFALAEMLYHGELAL